MSTLTGGTLNLVKPELTDDHKVTIGTDLPANFQKIDDAHTAHLADTLPHNMTQSQTANGYVKLPGGVIIQWGSNYLTDAGLNTVTLPITFPNVNVAVVANRSGINDAVGAKSYSTSQIYLWASAAGIDVHWIAIGY